MGVNRVIISEKYGNVFIVKLDSGQREVRRYTKGGGWDYCQFKNSWEIVRAARSVKASKNAIKLLSEEYPE